MTVNGKMPGEDVELPAEGGEVEIDIHLRSITPITRLMLIWNGELAEEIPLPEGRQQIDYSTKIGVNRSGWFHVRAEGIPEESYPLDTGFAQAFTNPTWVTVGGKPVRNRVAAEYSMKWIDKLTDMAEASPGWRSQKEKDHVFGQFAEARAMYDEFAKEADLADADVNDR